ncbi:hypothetical protein [Sporosarcina sp. FA9]|uniref:hypothetical protein n=1 Tax=Sporosarcina sp. FA9 TaxID=3413030 RepID=UPI003F65566F
MDTYEKYFKALSIPLTVIIVRLINSYVYDIPLLINIIIIGILISLFLKIIEMIPVAKKELSKKTGYVLLILATINIFLLFFLFDL